MLKRWRASLYRRYENVEREAYEKPTPYIYLLILLLIGLFSQAFFHNYNIVYLAMFFTFSIAISSYYFGRVNIKDIDFTLEKTRLYADTTNSLNFKVSAKNISYNIYLSDREDKEITFLDDVDKTIFSSLSLYCEKRGVQKLEAYKLLSKFPLPQQVFYKLKKFDDILVYPKPQGISLEKFLSLNYSISGDLDDFKNIKEFQTSDKIANIHWPLYASKNKLYVKEYNFNEENFELVFDYNSCAKDKESKLSQLCLWALECEKTKKDFIINMPNTRLDSTKMSIDEILKHLSTY